MKIDKITSYNIENNSFVGKYEKLARL